MHARMAQRADNHECVRLRRLTDPWYLCLVAHEKSLINADPTFGKRQPRNSIATFYPSLAMAGGQLENSNIK